MGFVEVFSRLNFFFKKLQLCKKHISSKAKNRFANQMDLLHSCRVEKRQDGKMFLASISGKYFFWMNESSDDHWEIIK